MSSTPSAHGGAAETRERILAAAGSLFSERGFESVSLRQITGEAGVNLAAVNYHFGSKQALVGEVLAGVVDPINRERLELLDAVEARHGGGPVPVEEMLEAFHRPIVMLVKRAGHESPEFSKLVGRCLSLPTEYFSESLVSRFDEVVRRFMAAAARALPGLDAKEVFWRMHLTVGTMIYALAFEERLALFSRGRVVAGDPEDTLRRLVEFTAAGLQAGASAEEAAAPERIPSGRTAPGSGGGRPGGAVAGMLALALLPAATACQSLSPPDARGLASVEIPAHWIASPDHRPAAYPDRLWAAAFRDPGLSEFIAAVLESNRDLKSAQARIEIAEANARIMGADLYPRLDGTFTAQRAQQSFIGLPLPGAPPGTVLSSRSNRFGLSLDLSWEADLWGRIRAAQSAAVAEFEASAFDRAAAELSLAGQAAKTWFALAESRAQASLARSTIAVFTETEQAIRERVEQGLEEGGATLASPLLLAEADTAAARDGLEARLELAGRAARQLDVLAGRYPSGRAGAAARLPAFPGPVPADLPATLLDRRPDLAAAERRIAAADQRLLEAKRALLPSLGLTGSYGTASDDISRLLEGDLSVWSIAGSAVQPLLQGGRLRANVGRRGAELDLAAAEFEQALLTAFAEVENALAAERFLARRAGALGEAAGLNRSAYERALEEYVGGTGDILTVLTAQQRLFASQSRRLEVERRRLENRVDLHLALGGSFRPSPLPPGKTPADP